MTLHYHGTPITPRPVLQSLAGRHFCVSFATPGDVAECHRIGQSVMLDNGAFSVWRRGLVVDWSAWCDWAQPWLEHPNTWAVLPDSIDGDESVNDHMVSEWAWMLSGRGQVVPVWHLHESFARLNRLVDQFGRVCFGSSGQYATVGSPAWHGRTSDAFDRLSDEFGRVPWVHMLRGMSLAGSDYPFASLDSTDVARNHAGQPTRGNPRKDARAMADRWDALQCPARWKRSGQLTIEEAA